MFWLVGKKKGLNTPTMGEPGMWWGLQNDWSHGPKYDQNHLSLFCILASFHMLIPSVSLQTSLLHVRVHVCRNSCVLVSLLLETLCLSYWF